jgi:hypothetical protein
MAPDQGGAIWGKKGLFRSVNASGNERRDHVFSAILTVRSA